MNRDSHNGRFKNDRKIVTVRWYVILIIMVLFGLGVALVEKRVSVKDTEEPQNDIEIIKDNVDVQPVDDEFVKDIKNSPEFKAKIENLAQQEALLKQKDTVLKDTENDINVLKDKIKELESARDTKISDIEAKLSELREENLSFR